MDAADSQLYTLAGFKVVAYYKCINPTCTDMWCNANCNHKPSFCPQSFCKKVVSKVPVPTAQPTAPPTGASLNGTPSCAAVGKADLCSTTCESTCRGDAPGFKEAGCTGENKCANTPAWALGSVCTCPPSTPAPAPTDVVVPTAECATGDALCISHDAGSYCKYWESPSVCHGSDIACQCEATPMTSEPTAQPTQPKAPTSCDKVTNPTRDQAMKGCPDQCTNGGMLSKEERQKQKGSVTFDECTDCFCQGCDDSLFEKNCNSVDFVRPTIESCAAPSCCPDKCLGTKFNVKKDMCQDSDCACCAPSLFNHMCDAEVPDQSSCPAQWETPCDPASNYMWDTSVQRCRTDGNSNFVFDRFAKTECCVPEEKAPCGAASGYKWDSSVQRCRTDMNNNGVFDQFAKSECCVPNLPEDSVCSVKFESKSKGEYYACCPASCGTCGGQGCSKRPGGKDNCCGHIIAEAGKSCEDNDVPCVFDPALAAVSVAQDEITGRWERRRRRRKEEEEP